MEWGQEEERVAEVPLEALLTVRVEALLMVHLEALLTVHLEQAATTRMAGAQTRTRSRSSRGSLMKKRPKTINTVTMAKTRVPRGDMASSTTWCLAAPMRS